MYARNFNRGRTRGRVLEAEVALTHVWLDDWRNGPLGDASPASADLKAQGYDGRVTVSPSGLNTRGGTVHVEVYRPELVRLLGVEHP